MPAPSSRPVLTVRVGTRHDLPLLARFNRELIADERSRTRLSVAGLEERMHGWISDGYRAILFELNHRPVGYAILRDTTDGVHLRQMYVAPGQRRRGIGRRAVELLREKYIPRGSRVWLEVLSCNEAARAFWRTTGFVEQLVSMEWPSSAAGGEPRLTHQVFIALGSNLGASREVIAAAMARLDDLSALPLHRSALWATSPVDCPPESPPFINAVVAWEPPEGQTPRLVLGQLQRLEREFGRRPKNVLNEPRPLDLDLIAWGESRCRTRELTLPHPRAHQRRFVLAPMAELAPNFILPGQRRSVQELLAVLDTDEVIERLSP